MAIPAIIAGAFTVLKIYTIVRIIITVLGAVFVAVQFFAGIDLTLSFASQVQTPTTKLITQLYDTLFSLIPFSLDSLVQGIDTALGNATQDIFKPTLTFSGLMNTVGFFDAFNKVVMCFLNGLSFILSVRFFRWALSKFGLKFL